ncbi:hypothetical protein M758_7G103100 [Ceratodon purpureus]|uniref:Uncharacterized protein n=1 Tax=Ceratodon purpureus TaxID=3225 RepID=A0A8T0H505_CERPU|nr:hypothetical protein KC19_7G109200 [Ceratodon purpureus]KAG0610950.1 hypothetical protein M758_7G103100 [Ceratodon purpureus]
MWILISMSFVCDCLRIAQCGGESCLKRRKQRLLEAELVAFRNLLLEGLSCSQVGFWISGLGYVSLVASCSSFPYRQKMHAGKVIRGADDLFHNAANCHDKVCPMASTSPGPFVGCFIA